MYSVWSLVFININVPLIIHPGGVTKKQTKEGIFEDRFRNRPTDSTQTKRMAHRHRRADEVSYGRPGGVVPMGLVKAGGGTSMVREGLCQMQNVDLVCFLRWFLSGEYLRKMLLPALKMLLHTESYVDFGVTFLF